MNAGENRDRFIPRAMGTTDATIQGAGYEVVGQLMGLAIRTGHLIPLNFPSIVWKQLVSDEVTNEDVKAIDVMSFQIVSEIETLLTNTKTTAEVFDEAMKDRTFSVYASDGKLHDLIPQGAQKPVTKQNARLFCELFTRFRLSEFTDQCAAIRRGLATVVPISLLSLFSWQELERMVAGSTFNVDLLFDMTDYSGCSRTDNWVQLFWRMMRERFNDFDRSRMLQFCWGRSRLPTSRETWGSQRFTITPRHGDPNRALPVSHTCFFSVEMPAYTSLDQMTTRCLIALNNTGGIDGDGARTMETIRNDVLTDDDQRTLFS